MATTSPAASSTSRKQPAIPPNSKPLVQLVQANAIFLNFAIHEKVLKDNIPPSLAIDTFRGDTFVSLTCMEIRRLPFLGLPVIPRFCELSLRCFVSERKDPQRQGVLCLKNYVSSKLGGWILNNLVPHHSLPLPIRANHRKRAASVPDLDYQWKIEGHENRIRVRGRNTIQRRDASTKLGFILSHSACYQSDHGNTTGYQISRPDWELWDAAQANFTCDVRRLFGEEYVKPLAARPVSVFLSTGSKVTIHRPASTKS